MNKFFKNTENGCKEKSMKNKFSVFFVIMAFAMIVTSITGFTKIKAFADNSLEFKSKAVYLCDANSGTVVTSHNETKRLPIASMCKIMTLLLAFESVDNGEISLNEEVTVSANASGMGGSQVFLEENGKYKVSELLKSITVASANDSCVAMAERLSGSEASFVNLMNEKAKSLGMDNTFFVNCTGLPKSGQYSCAKDVSVMFAELLKHKEYYIFSGIWTDKIEHSKGRFTEISNTNKLIRFYDGCDSGKTGYTSEAGHCLCASAVRNNMRLISVVVSAPDSKTRFSEVSNMFNYGFDNYVNKIIVDNNSPLDITVKVEDGKKDKLSVIAENSLYLFSRKDQTRSVEINFTPKDKVVAPITKGDVVGNLSVYENGILIDNVCVLANEDISEKTYFDCIYDILENWALY